MLRMKICVLGAGGAGLVLAARLAASGRARVGIVARGLDLDALRGGGVRLAGEAGDTLAAPVEATDDPATFGIQDYVIVAIRAPALPMLRPLIGPETCVVTIQDGVPWWYFHEHGGVYEKLMLDASDPLGQVWEVLRPERVLGLVLHARAERVAAGVARVAGPVRIELGEPAGEASARARDLVAAFEAGGAEAVLHPRIREAIWMRIWDGIGLAPVAALTGASRAAIVGDPGSAAIVRAMTAEARAVTEGLGISIPAALDELVADGPEPGMAADLATGRPIELDIQLGAVVELGQLTGAATPVSARIHALLLQRVGGTPLA